jgi:hypothetical protein
LKQTFDNIAVLVLDRGGLECVGAHLIVGEAALVDEHGDGCSKEKENKEKNAKTNGGRESCFGSLIARQTPFHHPHLFTRYESDERGCAMVISP